MEHPNFNPNSEKLKTEKKYVNNSNKNNDLSIMIKNLTSYIEINASKNIEKGKNEYIKKNSLFDLKGNNFSLIITLLE